MEKDRDFEEEFKENFLKLSKGITDPQEEKDNEYDLGIEFNENDQLQFEEEQKIKLIFENAVDKICKGLSFKEEE